MQKSGAKRRGIFEWVNCKGILYQINIIPGSKRRGIFEAPFWYNTKGVLYKIDKIPGAKRRGTFGGSFFMECKGNPMQNQQDFWREAPGEI